MRKVLAIVLLIFTLMSTEVKMALRNSAATGNRPAAQAANRPANAPAWLQGATQGGGNGGNNGGQEPARGTYRTGNAGNSNMTDVLKNKSAVMERTSNRDDVAASPATRYNPTGSMQTVTPAANIPAWLRNLMANNSQQGGGATRYDPINAGGYSPTNTGTPPAGNTYGGTNPNPDVTQGHLRGNNQPFVIGQDAITQVPGSPYDSYAGYRFPQLNLAVSGRSFGNEIGAGTLDPALWNTAGGGGGFGSSYGGNWRRGGGGGGGGGWGSDYGSADNYPAWMRLAMGLNSWNIK